MKASALATSAAIAVLALAAASGASAQGAFPSKNLVMIVPYTPGGSADAMSRAIAQRLGAAWNRTVVVDNRPGASGMIGTEMVTKAEPDGHTLLGHTSSYPATAAVRAKLPFDPAKAIIPVGMTARAPMLFAIHPSVPAKNIKELIALAKKNPGKFNYGSSGTGGNNHFSGALFASAAGIKMQHVPYKGGGPSATALIAGETAVSFVDVITALPQAKAGRLRPIAASTAKRTPLMPDLPTIAESGLPGFDSVTSFAMFAPAGVPREIIARVNRETVRALGAGDVKDKLRAQGIDAVGGTPEELVAHQKQETAKWGKVIREQGIKFE